MNRMKNLMLVLVYAGLLYPGFFCSVSHAASTKEQIEKQQLVEIKQYYLGDASKAALPTTPLAIEFYNQAVHLMEKHQYALARQSLQDSLRYEPRSGLAHELMGDLNYSENRLAEAKESYKTAYKLNPTPELQQKIERLGRETVVEKKMSTYGDEYFVIRYDRTGEDYSGSELRQMLRDIYRQISQDFGYYFRHKINVLLYSEQDFSAIFSQPHWVAGVYDGKVRLPVGKAGVSHAKLKQIAAHEVAHAFVSELSGRRAPVWINEGLAEAEADKILAEAPVIFETALKHNELFSLDELMSESSVMNIRDPLRIQLFYEQSKVFTQYLLGRYRMFRIKKLLEAFKSGKDSDEAIYDVLRISVPRLEKEWRESLPRF